MLDLVYALIQIIQLLTTVFVWIVIINFVLSLLIAFNVVNTHNQFVSTVYSSLNAIIEPVCRPIRKLLPDTGAIDFSPLVVIILAQILLIVLSSAVIPNLARM